MTNFNKRLDKIINNLSGKYSGSIAGAMLAGGNPEETIFMMNKYGKDTKQALTSLIKELVADEMRELLADEPLMDAEILHTTGYTDDEGMLHICKCGADYSDSKRKVQHNACRANIRSKLAEWLGEEK